jgi:hypothetical protein
MRYVPGIDINGGIDAMLYADTEGGLENRHRRSLTPPR